MEIRTNEKGKLYPYFSEYEMDLIREFRFADKNKSDDSIPIAEMVAMALHYHKGVLIGDAILYPILIPEDFEDDSPLVWDLVEAFMAPHPSNAAKLVGRLIEIAYESNDESQRSAIKAMLHRIGGTCERINTNHEGWNLPNLGEISEIWRKLVETDSPDFFCVLMSQKEYDELSKGEEDNDVR